MRLDQLLLTGTLLLIAFSAAPRSASAQELPAPTEPTPGAPRVHIEGANSDVILFRVPRLDEREQLGPTYRDVGIPVCRPPCDRIVDGRDGSAFFISSRASDPFRLRDTKRDVTLRVNNRALRNAGIVLTSVGPPILAAEVFFFLFNAFKDAGIRSMTPVVRGPSTPSATFDGRTVALLGWGVGGVASTLTGIAMIMASRRLQLVHGLEVPLGKDARLDGLTLRS